MRTISLVWMGVGVIALVLMAAAWLSVMMDRQYLEECRTRDLPIGVKNWATKLEHHKSMVKILGIILVAAIGGTVGTTW